MMAQGDPQYVITRDGHYLAHVGSGSAYSLTDADTFNPNTCLWYSGPNVEYNYYFLDDNGIRHYLSAPLSPSGALGFSDTPPATVVLNKPSENYFFYDWDDGLARGIQLDMSECNAHDEYHGVHNDECWKVVWVSYEGGSWQMSSQYGYNPTDHAARFRKVTVNKYAAQVIPTSGGAPTIADFAMTYGDPAHAVNGAASAFTYTYTPAYSSYAFGGNTYYFDANGVSLANAPTATTIEDDSAKGYAWELSGPGIDHLSLSNTTGATTSVTYHTPNTTSSHKMATLKLTVTYYSGGTEVRTATVTAKTQCQNPLQATAPVVSYEDVTLSWLPTADQYKLEYKKSEEDWNQAVSKPGITTTTYTINISDFEYSKSYDYRVSAFCGGDYLSNIDSIYHFSTHAEPDVIILGAVYGGGRMADVTGNTEVLMINCDSVHAVYGGNDIAGVVNGGSTITLGVNASDANAMTYNNGNVSTKVRIFDVYGGGNGYYAYNGTSIVPASYNTTYDIVNGASIMAITSSHPEGEPVWTNNTGSTKHWVCPTISTADITVTNNTVKIDSLFGGAKNAILNNITNDVNITIDGGTLYTVFGGNNYGGSLGYLSKEHIIVNQTTVKTGEDDYQAGRLGRDFGIGYLYGGGNKVQGQHIQIDIIGGQLDTVFGGGNSADVRSTQLNVNCNLANTYSKAIYNHSGSTIDSIDAAYSWNGTGLYNVRTLFGGNNKAAMSGLPTINLTSGSIGTLYGGGNAGDMLAQDSLVGPEISFDPIHHLENLNFEYSTKVVVNSPTILIDYLYGGCQMSNVGYSTWVRLLNGHVGTVYGGCNISGDVGSTRQDMSLSITDPHYQEVYGATYVEALGGTVYNDVFAGSNGYYHCVNGTGVYEEGIDYDPGHSYVGMTVPTHNETHVVLNGSVVVNNNVYAGGNMAPVGFTHTLVGSKPYPQDVGLASVRMLGGEVKGDVYGGGNMASINGSNEVRVAGGRLGTGPNGGALYGGNDRLGQAGKISNRVLPDTYNTASDNITPLTSSDSHKKVNTYIGITGTPYIHTVYGGGNGAYDYEHGAYCDPTNQPIQSNIFVDIAIDGGNNGGYIENVFGGGNGVYANGFIKVFLNVQNCTGDTRDHVGTIFGGNNIGNMNLIPDIILLNGNVHTVYGGCNKGALEGDSTVTVNGVPYEHIGGYVHLRKEYSVINTAIQTTPIITPTTASVTGAVYGGCRMNGVDNNTLVYVDGGNHTASLFGGSDISGNVGLTSRVIVNGGTVGNVYGGGNGNYYYNGNKVYDINDNNVLIDTIKTGTVSAPICAVSQVDIMKGNVGTGTGANQKADIYGGGLGHTTSTTGNVTVNIGTDTITSSVIANAAPYCPIVYGDIYGGSALGSVNTNASNTTTVNILNGTVKGNVYGGGLGRKGSTEPAVDPVEAIVNGKVEVNIGKSDSYNCFIDLRDANVFGCNNANGSPKDDVTVNVYQTAHNYSDYTTGNQYMASYTGNEPHYAIQQVFGGGNQADYLPANTARKTQVNVFGCYNTIGRVFGGGNAADAYAVETNIEGGRFHQVFGGGNGTPTAANIREGGASLNVSGGNILQLFGCNNINGSITGPLLVNITNDGRCDENIAEFFGGSNKASIGTVGNPANLISTINCGAEPVNINTVYGGSNLADIIGDVTVNIYGGEYENVYGGSKGQSGSSPDDAADIDGKVTLNLYGGTIVNAFGGSNVNGNITDTITVNVLDYEANNCPLDVTNIYGASNQTAYEPNSPTTIVSPIVNVMHIAQANGIRGNVYGGGNLASVTANPRVNIGYVADMADYVPSNFTKPINQRRAFVDGKVFGGGNEAPVYGNDTVMLQHANSRVDTIFGGGNKAGVNNCEVNIIAGTVATAVYGGCNESGTVTGDIAVNILNNLGATGEGAYNVNVFGGGLGKDTQTEGNVNVTIGTNAGGNTAPVIYGHVYGGSAMGSVNNGIEDVTKVWLRSGKVNGRVFGGGLGQKGTGDANIEAKVYGGVQVLVDDGEVTTAVYGCNDQNGAPQDTVNVKINGGKIANVVGGGNLAAYAAPSGKLNYPYVHITGGEVTDKVVGGGNLAGITGNPRIRIEGGSFATNSNPATNAGKGIYGGCNDEGIVTGNTTITILGDNTTAHQTTIGLDGSEANIHGGGYGAPTEVTGDVTVNFGKDSEDAYTYPQLFGAIYGGSAFGDVNTADESNTGTVTTNTTVNVYNGTVDGSIFGGGLGQKGTGSGNIEASVYGTVHVNIGKITYSSDPAVPHTLSGKASLVNCSVFGCNNQNGTPKDEVYVDVYQTVHTEKDEVDYYGADRTYAIQNVFGGGNQAHYAPKGETTVLFAGHKTHVYIHGCENTSHNVYGGGNAADALGVITIIEGGRFDEVFGGGNGMVTPANIGMGSIGINAISGHVSYFFEGSNRYGTNYSDTTYVPTPPTFEQGAITCSGDMIIDSYFFGANQAEIFGGLDSKINCEDAAKFHFMNVYAGSRWAIIYGDVKLTVRGGFIQNLFGGSRGYNQEGSVYSADIRRFPTQQELDEHPENYSDALKEFLAKQENVGYFGTGGNIELTVEGGTIGEVFGGCDVLGNIDGTIKVTVNDAENSSCPLSVGNIYGASNRTFYEPKDANIISPQVNVVKGTIGFTTTVFSETGTEQTFEGNVFGGGNLGNATCNPKVVIGEKTHNNEVIINGSVFGGGNEGTVTGSSQVIIVPTE